MHFSQTCTAVFLQQWTLSVHISSANGLLFSPVRRPKWSSGNAVKRLFWKSCTLPKICVVVCNALIIMLVIYISGYFHSLTVRLAALMISIFNILQNNDRRIQGNVYHKGVERQSKWNSMMKMLKTKVDSRISWASLCAVRGERRDRHWPANRRGESSLKLCRVGSGCKVKPKSLLLSAGSMSALGREHSRSSSRSLWGLLPQPRDTAG